LLAAFQDPEHHQGLWLMVTAIFGSVTALIFFVAALVAARQLHEARVLRQAQVRPFIVIDFHVLPTSMIYLRVSNLGSVIARDIRFSFDRPLTNSLPIKVMDLQIFTAGISSLPPGQVIETFFDTFFIRAESNDLYVATVVYRGEDRRKFRDQMDLDLGLYRNTSPIHAKTLDDIYKQVEKIAETLDDFKAGGGDGLLVLSPTDVAKRHEHFVAAAEEHRRARSASAADSQGPPTVPVASDAEHGDPAGTSG
jgi:hypothetical protein